ncbi:MAG: DUF4886 domain-containing protein [Clostridia bacterium]|nr:DUF4886 domain-containing protein [Clostridia bacterium]
MKRLIALLLLVALGLTLMACNDSNSNKETDTKADETTNPEESTTSGETTRPEETTTAGEETNDPDLELDPIDRVYPWAEVPQTLKILAIGNSFSVDAMEYLYQIAKDAGVKTVILGNLRVSGCTVDMHMNYAENNTAAYTYLKNTTGSWVSTDGYKFIDGLKDEEWDYITFQQASQLSGMQNSFNNLNKLVKFINNNKTNPDAQFLWHMTWAYQQNSTHSGFSNYGNSQQTMYEAITEAVQDVVLDNDRFVNVIPSGTAVQNARTSFMGDTLTRDGYHMYQPMGRYLVGLTYFAAITGADISNITYSPSSKASPELIAMFKESVTNAMNNKFEVTPSTYKTGSAENEVAQKTDAELAQAAGIDLSKYVKLDFEYVENKYWFCTQATTAPNNASSSQDGKFVCTKERFTKEQLLNAVIICDDGWQFRAEKWPNATALAASRGSNISDAVTLLNATWWGNDTYLALNISKTSGEKISSDYAAAATHVRIYVLIEEEAQE